MTEIHSFGIDPLTCHAFSANRSSLALSQNNNEIHIYNKNQDNKWVKNDTLVQHDLRVTSIDWAPKTNQIVSCSADLNAYVWKYSDGVWKPSLVILRINRAATCVRWSPRENKFAVGCGAKLINICYFEEANNWWISKHIKKPIKSTVTSVDWHPNNLLIACGSTDYKAKIFSTFIKEVDVDEGKKTSWGEKLIFGNLIGEFATGEGGWVHDISFSPDGNRLVWVSHDSTIAVVDSEKKMTITVLKTKYLPFLSCIWSNNDKIIAAGHDCCPMLFKYTGKLEFVEKLDKSKKKEVDGFSAMRKFKDMDKYMDYNSSGSNSEIMLDTIHQKTITELRVYSQNNDVADRISSISLDGKMVIWNVLNLSSKLSNMSIS